MLGGRLLHCFRLVLTVHPWKRVAACRRINSSLLTIYACPHGVYLLENYFFIFLTTRLFKGQFTRELTLDLSPECYMVYVIAVLYKYLFMFMSICLPILEQSNLRGASRGQVDIYQLYLNFHIILWFIN